MDETIDRIQKASKERQKLWRKSGQQSLNKIETKLLQTMTTDLAIMWDSYRREFASSGSVPNRY
jgi:hypothetical protein